MKRLVHHTVFFLTVVFACWTTASSHAEGTRNEGFILNQGQWPDSVLARATFDFGDVILKKDGLTFFLRERNSFHSHASFSEHGHDSTVVINAHVYKMKFRNASFHMPTGFTPSTFHVNMMKGDDPSKWAENLFCYKKLIVENIYPSIDLILYVTNNGIKYDLSLKDNADSKKIIIDYEGLDGLSLDSQGSLQLKTSLGTVTEQMPIAFIEKNNLSKEPVFCQYQLKEKSVRFDIKNMSRSRKEKLVIDPQLIFATYSGSVGNADNWGNTATYDSLGCLYAAGIAFNFGFPVTTGAYQIGFASLVGTVYVPGSFYQEGDPDVAIMKYSPTGSLLFATYLGGGATEVPTSIIVNNKNELYVLGTTSSSGTFGPKFPITAGAYDTTYNGGTSVSPLGPGRGIYYDYGSDLFISHFNAAGSGLLSSTFIGGSGNDGLMLETESLSRNYSDQFRSEILLDSLGFVYLASHTQSNNILNPSKPGFSNMPFKGGGRDGIVIKLTPTLTDIVWNTYWGGSGLDACYSLQFDQNNDLFVAGGTTSPNLPVIGGLHTGPLGSVDGFIVKIKNADCSFIAATYLGTTFTDQCYLVQTDKSGFVYVLGQSTGNYPILNAPYKNVGSHQFVHKLSPLLNQSIFSTQIGSSQNKIDIVPTAFLVNDCENIFIAGWGGEVNSSDEGLFFQGGNTYNLPTTANAFQKTTIDGSDFYLMVLKKDVEKLLYATFFGGSNVREHVDGGTSRFDKRGIVYESVCACFSSGTPNFPVTPGAHSATIKSINCNNAVFKFDLSSLKADFIADTLHRCGMGPVTFTNKSIGGASFSWDFGDGETSNAPSSVTHNYRHPGIYTVKLTAFDEATCIGVDIAQKNIKVDSLPSVGIHAHDVFVCAGDTVILNSTANINFTYLWSPNQYLTNNTIYNPGAFPPSDKTYHVLIKDVITGCENSDSVNVKVIAPLPDTRYQNLTGCSGKPKIKIKNFSDSNGFLFAWDFGDGNTATGPEVTHNYEEFGDYIATVTVYNSSCSLTDTVHVHLPVVKIPNLFTPNEDNHNDKYVIEGMTDDWKLEVFNRWGNLIYTRQPYDQSWAGEDLNGGVYYFLITDPSGNKCKGWVHVLK